MNLLQGVGEDLGVAEQPSGLATVELQEVPGGRYVEPGVEEADVGRRGAGEGFQARPHLPRSEFGGEPAERVACDEAVGRQLAAADGDYAGRPDPDDVLARGPVGSSVVGRQDA